ncbi:hypothetical protein Tco_0929459 [Tanacetum coccineum]
MFLTTRSTRSTTPRATSAPPHVPPLPLPKTPPSPPPTSSPRTTTANPTPPHHRCRGSSTPKPPPPQPRQHHHHHLRTPRQRGVLFRWFLSSPEKGAFGLKPPHRKGAFGWQPPPQGCGWLAVKHPRGAFGLII